VSLAATLAASISEQEARAVPGLDRRSRVIDRLRLAGLLGEEEHTLGVHLFDATLAAARLIVATTPTPFDDAVLLAAETVVALLHRRRRRRSRPSEPTDA
jgi:hypothetical protein